MLLVVPLALLVPVLWVAWMLLRGAVIGSYPYGFVAVGERGYPAVLATIAMILAFGLVVVVGVLLVCLWLLKRLGAPRQGIVLYKCIFVCAFLHDCGPS